jgi:deoxyribodipyrimidine photolyase-related protein
MNFFLVFPHQLFKDISKLKKYDKIILLEDSLFFYDSKYPIKFHKQKLILHRASLKAYQKYLTDHGLKVEYQDYQDQNLEKCLSKIPAESKLSLYDPVDFIATKRLNKFAAENNLQLKILDSPNFITTEQEFTEFFKSKKRLHQTDFYRWQRVRFNILINPDKTFKGGKLTFDTENRKKLPAKITVPEVKVLPPNEFVKEAIKYISKHFPGHPGEVETFNYPTTFKESEAWLEKFLQERFELFGLYEDAISADLENPFLFHSGISAVLNIGLLDPKEVISKAILANPSLNSLEGFIRQILGWREFMRAVYILKGVEQRNLNFLNHTKSIPEEFWTAKTGIEPIDAVIKKLLKYAYSHHIERLMVMSNFMNLAEFHPDQIYEWFMTFYIDAYDWVMVPNVYGMSLYADGGLITTKPYVSSSNYILKMSNFKKADWAIIWDALYWNFVAKHKDLLSKNIRFGLILKQLEKMDEAKKQTLKKVVNDFFKTVK